MNKSKKTIRLIVASTFVGLAAFSAASTAASLGDDLAAKDVVKLQDDLQLDLKKTLKKDLTKSLLLPKTRAELGVYRLIQLVGVKGIESVRQSPDGPKFLAWLASKPDALEDYLSSGSPVSYNDYGLKVWAQIWAKYPDSHEGIGLRLATAIGLQHFRSWNDMTYLKPLDPVKRYQFFMNSRKAGLLWPYFEKEKTYEMCYIVVAWAPDTELTWIRDHVPPTLKNMEHIGEMCWLVPYRDHNERGTAWDRLKFYGGPETMDAIMKMGGVCIQISEFTSSSAQAFGLPAIQLGQPSHNCTAWRNKEGSWALAYNNYAWPDTSEEFVPLQFGRRAALLWVADAAQADTQAYLASERLFWAAQVMGDKKLDTLTAAVERCPLNYPAVREAAAEAAARLKGDELFAYLKKIALPFKDYPLVLSDIVADRLTNLPPSLATKCKAVDVVEALLQAMADGDPAKQLEAAVRARATIAAKVVSQITKAPADLNSPLWNGKERDKAIASLDPASRMTYLKAIELLLRTGLKRKDLYEQPLKTYAVLAAQNDETARRAIPALGIMAKQAAASGQVGFAVDAAHSLYEICLKTGRDPEAEQWKGKFGPG